MADCPACGSILAFDIKSQMVKCTSCSSSFQPEEVESTQHAEQQEFMGVTEFLCPNCGGEIFSTDRDMTGVCTYCGSKVVFESRLTEQKRPNLIIPFQKTKEDCKNLYLEHLKSKFFVPKELKSPEYISEFRGVYMPYWIADAKQAGKIRYYGKHSYDKGSYEHIDTYRVTGSFEAGYHGLYHDAGKAFSDDISEKLEPFYLVDKQHNESCAKPFYPAYLSGFYAEPSDVEFEEYQSYFQDIADRQTDNYLKGHPALGPANANGMTEKQFDDLDKTPGHIFDRERIWKKSDEAASGQSSSSDVLNQNAKYGYKNSFTGQMTLFPVWFMAWKNRDRVAYFTVNGQTGRVVADLPIDLKKFFLVFAALFAVCFGVTSFFTIRSYTMPVIAVWFSAVTAHMSYKELCTRKEHSGEVKHTTRGSNFDSSSVGLIALIILAAALLSGFVLQKTDSDFTFLSSHLAYCAYAILGLIYTVIACIISVKQWLSLDKTDRSIPAYLLTLIASVLGTGLVITNTPNDLMMYGVTAATFFCIIVSMLSMVLQMNQVITRPLPQFEHKGGDDRA